MSVFRSFYTAGKLLFLNTSKLHVWFRDTTAKLRTEPGISCIHVCPLQYDRERVSKYSTEEDLPKLQVVSVLYVAEESQMLILIYFCVMYKKYFSRKLK